MKPNKDIIRGEQLSRLIAAQNSSIKICIDLQYEHLMNTKELNHLSNQLKRVYSANKKSLKPFHLYFTNLNMDGEIYKTCCQKNVGFDRYLVDMEELNVLQIFDSDDLIYLSPDADNYLTEMDMDKVYVIGGLVDDSVKKQVTLNFSNQSCIQTYKLPIPLYMERKSEGSFKQILTINQIFEILLKFYETEDWREALAVGVPAKTGFTPKRTASAD